MYIQTNEVDYRPALKRLKTWLIKKGLTMLSAAEWAHWKFNARPFWSTWVSVFGPEIGFETWGVQIYDEGEIILVTKRNWVAPDEKGKDD